MVAQRRNRNEVRYETDQTNNAELIYVTKNKEEEEEELMVPFLLESMFEAHSPVASLEFAKELKDDSTVTLTPSPSFSGTSTTLEESNDDSTLMTDRRLDESLMIPTLFDDEPDLTTAYSFDEEPTMINHAQDSLPTLSPRSIVIPTDSEKDHPFTIPRDVRYDGRVIFATAPVERNIKLHPKPLSRHSFESIFKSKTIVQDECQVYHVYIEEGSDARRGSEYNGVEESKEECDDDCHSITDEGFAYVFENQHPEDQYWRSYPGHYGSLSMEGDYEFTRHNSMRSYCNTYVPNMNFADNIRSESLIGMFTDFFACGAYGKPFASTSSTCSIPNPCAISVGNLP